MLNSLKFVLKSSASIFEKSYDAKLSEIKTYYDVCYLIIEKFQCLIVIAE